MARMGWATHQGPTGPRGRRATAQAVALALMFALAFAALAGFASIAKAKTPSPRMGKADPQAAAIAAKMDDAMGGMTAWESVPYVRFDFVIYKDGKEAARFRHW